MKRGLGCLVCGSILAAGLIVGSSVLYVGRQIVNEIRETRYAMMELYDDPVIVYIEQEPEAEPIRTQEQPLKAPPAYPAEEIK